MHHTIRRPLRQRLTCTRCGREIPKGEEYWYLNGASVCSDCLVAFAQEELSPYRHVREEDGHDLA